MSIMKSLISNTDTSDGAAAALARLERATNAHDLNALVACFAPDYRNDTPAHPERSFTGREQVRRNWEQIFAGIPDITAKVLRSAVNGDEAWSEWEHRGTRRDGSAHLMRGVVIVGVANGLLTWARFYLEPVQEGGENVDAAVRRQVAVATPPPTASSTERR
jgi:ketosteroid isomerase-like protein